jgi:hypothetical protein
VPSGWWRQSIAVGYEQARGKRQVGETANAGYQAQGLDEAHAMLEMALPLLEEATGHDSTDGSATTTRSRPSRTH